MDALFMASFDQFDQKFESTLSADWSNAITN